MIENEKGKKTFEHPFFNSQNMILLIEMKNCIVLLENIKKNCLNIPFLIHVIQFYQWKSILLLKNEKKK